MERNEDECGNISYDFLFAAFSNTIFLSHFEKLCANVSNAHENSDHELLLGAGYQLTLENNSGCPREYSECENP